MNNHDIWQNKLSPVKISYLQNFAQGSTFLDAGSGTGHYSHWIKQQHTQACVIAVDHLESIEHNNLFSYVCANLEKQLPLSDNTFDTIIAFDIIEHITNEAYFINELFRICKTGGVIIGSVPHNDDAFLPAYNLTFRHRRDLTHKRYYTDKTLENALSQCGFMVKIIDKQGGINPQVIAEFFPRPLQFIVKKSIGMLRRLQIVKTNKLASDLFFVAYKPNQLRNSHAHN